MPSLFFTCKLKSTVSNVVKRFMHWQHSRRLRIAFVSTASRESTGRTDVYIARFPDGSGRVQVTGNGGGAPFWSRDGRELFFTAPPDVLQVVSVSFGDRLQVGEARTLVPTTGLRIFGISPDGARFLGGRFPRVDPPTEIVVVENWLQELRRLVPSP